MTNIAKCLRREIVASGRLWIALVLSVFFGFHVLQLAALMLRFEAVPNYVTIHDWPGSVARIIRSTPAVLDMLPIIADEWLIEIGSMNYSFGRGIAEWSFVLMPAKLVVVLAIAILVATDIVLLRATRRTCSLPSRIVGAATMTTGALAACAATTSITWVVCCAAPTWVVGLSIMGLGVTTALALAPIGGWLLLLGALALLALAVLLARTLSARTVRLAAELPTFTPTRMAEATS